VGTSDTGARSSADTEATTRAELFRRAIVAGGATVGGVAAWGVPELTSAASPEQDARVLNLVLALEYTEAAFYQEALDALAKLVFQTYRSRLYRAAALVALNRAAEARRLVREAMAGNPGLTASSFMFKERYRDLEKRRELQRRLVDAGLPA